MWVLFVLNTTGLILFKLQNSGTATFEFRWDLGKVISSRTLINKKYAPSKYPPIGYNTTISF